MRESVRGQYLIVLADDHALFRKGLRKILGETADLKVVGEAGDGLELLFINVHTVERHRANIMPKLNLKKTADLVKLAIQNGYI